MPIPGVHYLTFSDVLQILDRIKEEDTKLPEPDIDGSLNIMDTRAVESIIDKAKWGIPCTGEPDLFDSAAIYVRDFATEHHVSNANKRCGFVCCEVFLELNGVKLKHEKMEAATFVQMEVVVNKAGHDEIKEWISSHSTAMVVAKACR